MKARKVSKPENVSFIDIDVGDPEDNEESTFDTRGYLADFAKVYT